MPLPYTIIIPSFDDNVMRLNPYFDGEGVGVNNNTSDDSTNKTRSVSTDVDAIIRTKDVSVDIIEQDYLGVIKVVERITDATIE